MFLVSEPGSSVTVVSGYGLDDRAIEVRSLTGVKSYFSSASVCRQVLGLTQPPVQWVPGVPSPGRDADHSPPSSAEVENEWELYLLSPKRLRGE
jgi:hypothetical protein